MPSDTLMKGLANLDRLVVVCAPKSNALDACCCGCMKDLMLLTVWLQPCKLLALLKPIIQEANTCCLSQITAEDGEVILPENTL